MIAKEDLLFHSSKKDDDLIFKKLKEYDSQEGGVMLYRYRHISRETPFEIDALKKCKIWASSPNNFDDKYEFMPTSISKRDYECIRFFMDESLKDVPKKERVKKLENIDKAYHINGRHVLKIFYEELKKSRCEYAVSCFTENAPYDNNHNMWQQYAKDSGICLGYSLKTMVEARVAIDPVYYVDSQDKNLANMFALFGKNIKAGLCFCIKEKCGVDQFEKAPSVISWSDQKEWRYAIPNTLDKSTNEYSNGCYVNRRIVPDIVYVKNLDAIQYFKVWCAAKKNRIKIERLS